MKESRRAARDEDAHRRLIAAAEKLSTDGNPSSESKIAELKAIRQRRLTPDTAAMMEREILADILEGIEPASGNSGSGSSKRRRSKSGESAEGG